MSRPTFDPIHQSDMLVEASPLGLDVRGTTMEIPLSRVPELFFDRQLWEIFVSYFDGPETALETIGHPPGPAGYHRDDDPSETTTDRWREIEEAKNVGVAILLCLQQKFLTGELVASGIPLGFWKPTREPIPPSYWLRLWANFSENTATSTQETYQDVLVSYTPKSSNAELQERLEDFLIRQKLKGQEARKILVPAADEYFGESIPARVFNKSYSRVFKKKRGRPSKK